MGTTNFSEVVADSFTGALFGNLTGTWTAFPVTARTATTDGTGTGTIAAGGGALQAISVTSDNADKIIILPAPVVGMAIVLINGATGYELRSSAPATISINGGAGANAESAIAASTAVVVLCTSATTWAGFSILLSSLEAAA